MRVKKKDRNYHNRAFHILMTIFLTVIQEVKGNEFAFPTEVCFDRKIIIIFWKVGKTHRVRSIFMDPLLLNVEGLLI